MSDKPSIFNQSNSPATGQQPAFDPQNLPPEVLQQLQQQAQGQPQAELRDIHLPDTVSWFPPAIGWWLVLALVIALITGLRALYVKQQARKATAPVNWRPALQEELAMIQQQYVNSQNQQQLAIELSQLLRKTVVKENPQQANQLAGLTGPAWLAALDQHFGYGTVFSQSAIALTQAPYNPNIAFNADSLIKMVNDALNNPAAEESPDA